MDFSRKTTKRFSGSVSAGSSETFAETIDNPATVERVAIRFYDGPRLSLEVSPVRIRGQDRVPLIDHIGLETVVGDDDYFEFHVSEELEEDDELAVEVTNTGDYDYHFVADIDVDYAGGVQRILGGVLS